MFRATFVIPLAMTIAVLANCSMIGGDDDDIPKLLRFKNTGSPDELSVVSSRPLEYPELSIPLQPPLSSGENRADRRPKQEVVTTLGGNSGAETPISTFNDRHLTTHTTRFGYNPIIRQQLESEDLAYRRRNDGLFLERVFNVNVYYDAYRPMSIDPYDELNRLRRYNIKTPAAPPENLSN